MIPTKYIIPTYLPGFIKEDYPAFIEFLRAYFEFVESEGIDLQDVRDPWNTTDSFLDKLLKDLLPEVSSIPLSTDGKRLLASKIIDLRKSKGSTASYELFFKLFFGSSVDIEIPYDDVLIPSASRWVQNYSMLVQPIFSSNVFDELRGKRAFVSNGSELVTINVSNVNQIDDNLYEVFFDRSFTGTIDVGDNLLSQTYSSKFTILTSLSTIKVGNRGVGFKGGTFVTLDNPSGNPATFKITKTGTGGAILSIEFRDQGFGFDSNKVIYFAPPPNDSVISSPAFFTQQEAIDYYKTFRPDLSDESISTLIASSTINVGSFCKRAGFYEDNKNILSDVVILQGGRFYQKYSYVTKVQKRLEEYKTLLKTMIHPAGFALFGSFDVYQKGSIKLSWKNFIQRTYVRFYEHFSEVSTSTVKDTVKRRGNVSNASVSIGKSVLKSLTSIPSKVSSLDQKSANKIRNNNASVYGRSYVNFSKASSYNQLVGTSLLYSITKSRSNVSNASVSIGKSVLKPLAIISSNVSSLDEKSANKIRNNNASVYGRSYVNFSKASSYNQLVGTSLLYSISKSRSNSTNASANIKSKSVKSIVKAVNTSESITISTVGPYVDVNYIQGGSYLYANGLPKQTIEV